jgi:putative acetyltransferase
VIVREATQADLATLERFLPTGQAQVHASHLASAAEGRTSFLVAWEGERPLGTGVVRWDGPVGDVAAAACPGVPEIAHLHVAEEARGRGAGTALVSRAEDLVRARGHDRCALGVAEENTAAARLYSRLGYRDVGAVDVVSYTWVDETGAAHPTTETCRLLVADLVRDAVLDDAPALHAIALEAIRVSAATHYTDGQRQAWAARRTVEGHRRFVERSRTLVALVAGEPAGFVSVALTPVASLAAGEVDQLFVHPDHGGRGIASALLARVDRLAADAGLDELVTHASHRAAPVFERGGWRRVEVESVEVDGQVLTRTRMTRRLDRDREVTAPVRP